MAENPAIETFEEMVSSCTPPIQEIARRLRALVQEIDPDVVEVIWLRQQIAGYGVGPKKMSEHYTYIAPQSAHVNLGFYYGAHLPDPEGRMGGSGRNMRHVKVRSLDDAADPALKALVAAALQERCESLGLDEM